MSKKENIAPGSIGLPVLLVDDEPELIKGFSVALRGMGFKNVLSLTDGREVMPLLARQDVSLIVLDLSMPHVSGRELLAEVIAAFPAVPVIIATARGEIETAVECMRSGAFDYLVKPVEKGHFEASVKRASELALLRGEVNSLKRRLLSGALENEAAFSGIITVNKALRAVLGYVEAIAPSDQPMLITGETGVGKELVAKAAHDVSNRGGAFVAVNVAGLDDTMFSDTLFGHKKGAYTGADESRDGLITQAGGGTIFLDEIGDTTESSQIKLLRLLQERKYYQLGSDVPRESAARVIVATNHDLQALLSEGRFRKDLYYRLCAHTAAIPPLRERKEDIPLLINRFFDDASRSMKKARPQAPPELVTLLKTYSFPGNVRELQAMVWDAVARHKGGPSVSMESFKAVVGQRGYGVRDEGRAVSEHIFDNCTTDNFPTLKAADELLIKKALELSSGNQGIAGMLLGITRQALNKRLVRKKN
ncbi:sigma-54-dependent Fis family transcriptional regulator [bacterium]|nr:MAG: sigma-54-dependent Fis family transcriptional regulator [bacterium]